MLGSQVKSQQERGGQWAKIWQSLCRTQKGPRLPRDLGGRHTGPLQAILEVLNGNAEMVNMAHLKCDLKDGQWKGRVAQGSKCSKRNSRGNFPPHQIREASKASPHLTVWCAEGSLSRGT